MDKYEFLTIMRQFGQELIVDKVLDNFTSKIADDLKQKIQEDMPDTIASEITSLLLPLEPDFESDKRGVIPRIMRESFQNAVDEDIALEVFQSKGDHTSRLFAGLPLIVTTVEMAGIIKEKDSLKVCRIYDPTRSDIEEVILVQSMTIDGRMSASIIHIDKTMSGCLLLQHAEQISCSNPHSTQYKSLFEALMPHQSFMEGAAEAVIKIMEQKDREQFDVEASEEEVGPTVNEVLNLWD